MTATLHPVTWAQHHPQRTHHRQLQDRPLNQDRLQDLDWGDETGAQTAEYGIVTLAAVGFAGVLAVILAGADVQGLLLDLVKSALSFG